MWNEAYLDEMLSTPSKGLIDDIQKIDGDIMILGAGGKVGPSLCLMAARAIKAAGVNKKLYAVSRFSDPIVVELLKNAGVEMLRADLTKPEDIALLPKVPNIIFMAGRKFGTGDNAGATWVMNTAVPALVIHHFGAARYVVFSTGNVYPFTPIVKGGSVEEDATGPVGEYAMSCLGRERIFQDAAKTVGAKVLLYRLNYAVDLRYGVLCDLANNLLSDKPIALSTGAFNCVWQGYANEVAIRSLLLADSPAQVLNITGPETVSVRDAATRLGKLLGHEPVFEGEESDAALLNNAGKCFSLFGYPELGVRKLIELQADWLLSGGRTLNKPTHFEERKGNF